MRCQAKTKTGSRCQHKAWQKWPLCQTHIQMAIKELRRAQGFTELYVVKQPEPDYDFIFELE
jgi:hypothetical protein